MTNVTRTGLVVLVLTSGVAGCGGLTPAAPSTVQQPVRQPVPQPVPPTPLPPPTSTAVQLAGTVSDAAYRPLAGARVEVVDGPQAGRSTTADARGEYRLTGEFDATTRFRATKEGHVAATWPLPPSCDACTPHWWLHFYLETVAPHPNIAGVYTLTFIADTACVSLPEEARTRTFQATIAPRSGSDEPANSRYEVTVSSPQLIGEHNGFTIGMAGNYLMGYVGDWGHDWAGVVEEVEPNTYITLMGEMKAHVTDASTISASFQGIVNRCRFTTGGNSNYSCSRAEPNTRFRCESDNHRLILTR